MQYALVQDELKEAQKGLNGFCQFCGDPMVSKCGPRVIHHWAHARNSSCDLWWENETAWHRNWKNHFSTEAREVIHTATDGERHIADIKTNTGIIIEFQHSPMNDKERKSREDFYKNLIWVIDGSTFEQNFDIYHILPRPDCDLAKDIIWAKSKRGMLGTNSGMFFRLSEARKDFPNIKKSEVTFGRIYSLEDIKNEITNEARDYYQYDWVRPRKTWIDSACPVFIDFGEDYLVKLTDYDESGLKCIRLISKKKFMLDVNVEASVYDVAK